MYRFYTRRHFGNDNHGVPCGEREGVIRVIKAEDLISKFKYAIEVKGGYIWGTSGKVWTEKDQANTGNEQAIKYGSRWIGHQVWDCSGMFRWAYRQLGTDCAHGSNSIFNRYCKETGRLKNGKRTDGKELKPGTAVFTGTEGDHGHIGLYIGGGKVIEAKGTQSGVVESKVTDSKWTFWGELKNVDYGTAPAPEPEPVKPGYAEVTGKRVALRSAPTTQASVIMRIDTGKTVKIESPPPSEWEYVSYQGKSGYMMKKFLREG